VTTAGDTAKPVIAGACISSVLTIIVSMMTEEAYLRHPFVDHRNRVHVPTNSIPAIFKTGILMPE